MKIAKYLFNYQGKKKNKTSNSSALFGAIDSSNRPVKYRIDEALDILKESKLKIDDLLPLFPPDEKV
jgi:hypothetical protein